VLYVTCVVDIVSATPSVSTGLLVDLTSSSQVNRHVTTTHTRLRVLCRICCP